MKLKKDRTIESQTAEKDVWEVRYAVDDFGRKTDDWLVTNKYFITGVFNNIVTTRSPLYVKLICTEEAATFQLYEYGRVEGIYSKYEYLDRIFFDSILGENNENDISTETKSSKYDTIGEYKVKDYKERPHEYTEE